MIYFFIIYSFLLYSVLSDTECPIINSFLDRRNDKNKLRLMQYNVEWLFIDYYNPMDCPGNGCTWKNESESIIHMVYVANVINTLKPDIINLCEVEGCDELKLLNDKLNDNYISYLKKGTDTATGQNVGMLTRIDPIINLYRTDIKHNYPISNSKCGYTGLSGTYGVSKHYITEFNINNINIAFISAHLLAIPNDKTRCAEREAQASVLQNIIYSYLNKEYEIIMIGDFNDYDNEIMDVNNNKAISSVLDILKGKNGDYAGKYNLYNVAEEIVQNQRYSDWWDSDNNCNTLSQSDYSMIDHILVTDYIKKHIINAFIYHGYKEYCGKYDSDHFPLVIDLQF